VADVDADAEVVAAADDPDDALSIRNSALACDVLDRILTMLSRTKAAALKIAVVCCQDQSAAHCHRHLSRISPTFNFIHVAPQPDDVDDLLITIVAPYPDHRNAVLPARCWRCCQDSRSLAAGPSLARRIYSFVGITFDEAYYTPIRTRCKSISTSAKYTTKSKVTSGTRSSWNCSSATA
jgi:hypothetical protein